jgi:hypothetical protein
LKNVAVLVALVLLPLLVSPAIAGIEPSPFQPELRKLNAIINCLSELEQRVGAAAGGPITSSGIEPSPWRAVNQLDAAARQLRVLGGHLEAVLAVPDVQDDDAVNAALLEIVDWVKLISYETRTEPSGEPTELETAMLKVNGAAEAILNQLGWVSPS